MHWAFRSLPLVAWPPLPPKSMLEGRLGAAAALLNIDFGGKGGDIRLAISRIALGWREKHCFIAILFTTGRSAVSENARF